MLEASAVMIKILNNPILTQGKPKASDEVNRLGRYPKRITHGDGQDPCLHEEDTYSIATW